MTQSRMELRGIQDPRVLEAMRKVDRRRFVPEALKPHAFDDRALAIGHEQTISQPYIVALMCERLELAGLERVLEIGTGSGYQAAILGELAREVYTMEIIPELAERASALLKELGYAHVHVRQADGHGGWPDEAPFDAITVACAPDHVPVSLVHQLQEGGRLVIPVGVQPKQTLRQFKKIKGTLVERDLIPVSFVPMTGAFQ